MYPHEYNYHIANILSTTRSESVKTSLSYIVDANRRVLNSCHLLYDQNQKLKQQLKKANEEIKFLHKELNKYKNKCYYGESSDKERIYELIEENDSLKIEIEELQILKESLQEEKFDM